jgi:hypothetical protein
MHSTKIKFLGILVNELVLAIHYTQPSADISFSQTMPTDLCDFSDVQFRRMGTYSGWTK